MNLSQSSAILLSQRAALTPDREALLLTDSGDRFSYGELDARANRCANWLLSLGIGYGDTVSILAQNGITYLDLFFGCARIGAVFAPLNWRLVAAELSYIVNDCQSQLLIFGPEYADVREELAATTAIPHQFSLAEYEAAQAMAEPGPPPVDERIGPESIHCILYTSGTTGRPKGALISGRQVVWNCINTVVSWGLTADDVSPVFTPMFHAGGLFAFLTPIFYAGGRILLSRAFDPELTLKQIEDEGCTVILGVPTLFQLWLKSPQLARTDFSRVRYFISGGAPCPVPLMQAWREATGTVFRQGYGLSEVGPNCFSMTDEESEPKSGSVGKPIFHSQMRLVDENGQDVPAGAIGELIIKGPHVCSGYLNNPEATAAALRDGWFHTGDMARQDEDGFFYISGRFKDMIISGGENVYAAEVEAVFLTHPQVAECALIGKPDEKWGEIGLMLVVPAGPEPDADALLAHCGERLARYKIPKEIQFVDSLPYSPYGKVEKVKLRVQYL
ncbi:MAG: long-chain fatty acid--CoA ligase [Ardenticatenales bacterium]|nr:long-chain fatty acid--CoA ligase [Ardenticatenales bacterium]